MCFYPSNSIVNRGNFDDSCFADRAADLRGRAALFHRGACRRVGISRCDGAIQFGAGDNEANRTHAQHHCGHRWHHQILSRGTVFVAYVLAVRAGDILLPGQGGMSVAPDDPADLPTHRRPVSLGGTGRDPVWYIESDDLGPDLHARQGRPGHALIEPSRPVILQVFQDALAATRWRWKLYCR